MHWVKTVYAKTPVLICLETGATIQPTIEIEEGETLHRVELFPNPELKTNDLEDDIGWVLYVSKYERDVIEMMDKLFEFLNAYPIMEWDIED